VKFEIRKMQFSKSLPPPISATKFLPDIIRVRPNGKVRGRKRKMTESEIESAKKLLASGTSYKVVARNLGVNQKLLYYRVPMSSSDDV
jgi:hypothetical protein